MASRFAFLKEAYRKEAGKRLSLSSSRRAGTLALAVLGGVGTRLFVFYPGR
jgi:hypothetical protein